MRQSMLLILLCLGGVSCRATPDYVAPEFSRRALDGRNVVVAVVNGTSVALPEDALTAAVERPFLALTRRGSLLVSGRSTCDQSHRPGCISCVYPGMFADSEARSALLDEAKQIAPEVEIFIVVRINRLRQWRARDSRTEPGEGRRYEKVTSRTANTSATLSVFAVSARDGSLLWADQVTEVRTREDGERVSYSGDVVSDLLSDLVVGSIDALLRKQNRPADERAVTFPSYRGAIRDALDMLVYRLPARPKKRAASSS